MPDSLFYSWKAEEDLAALYLRHAQTNPERARGLVLSIEERCHSLCDFPEQGRARGDLGNGVRILAFAGMVVIAYRILEDRIEILRLFPAGRDYERWLRPPDGN